MNGSHTSQRGFTLLEVLIAISLLAGIMMALGPAISAAAKAASRIHKSASLHETSRTLQMFFRDTVEQNIYLLDSSEMSSIQGNSTELFITTYDPDASKSQIVTLKITLPVLFAELSITPEADLQKIEVLDNLVNAKFEFLDSNNGAIIWKTEWDDKEPPKLVRFSGAINKQGVISEFSFEAAPTATSPFECQFDAVSRQCL